jgi:hypothetical protein
MGIELHNSFWFSLYRVIMVLRYESWIWQVNPGWLGLIQYIVVSILFLKKKTSLRFLWIKLYFYQLSVLLLNPLIWWSQFLYRHFEKHWWGWKFSAILNLCEISHSLVHGTQIIASTKQWLSNRLVLFFKPTILI